MKPTEQEIQDYNKALNELINRQAEKDKAITNASQTQQQYEFVLSEAKKNNRNIFLLFYLDGCSGCTVIKHLVLYHEEINKILDENYEVLLINMTTNKTHLANKYNLYSFPSCFIIDQSEKIIKKNIGCPVVGGVENNFLRWLQNN